MRPIDADVLVKKITDTQAKVGDAHIFFDGKAVLDMIEEVPTLPCCTEVDDGQSDKKN